jgi:DNA-binding transcriptional ArsR family regulator
MAEELLERVLREIRERKDAARAAVDEYARLERALAALDHRKPRVAAKATTSRRARRRTRPAKRAPRGANRDAILALVRERPGVTTGEIAHATGIARSTVSPTLARLAGAGLIERVELPGSGVGFRAAADE